MKPQIITSLLALALTASASASVLMLDFGPTTPTSATTNSPYHTANGSFTNGNWNVLGLSDIASGLVFSDNSAATGVSVNLGITTTTTVNLASQPGSTSALAAGTSVGVYSGNSVGTDGIFSGNSTSGTAVGLQIGGLSAGTYDIYVAARNTNVGTNAGAYTQIVYASAAASGDPFNFSGYSNGTLSYTSASTSEFTTSWVQGENYIKLSVSLSSGELLNVAVDGGGTGRGFINAVQIVQTSSAIPEPSTYGAIGGLAVLGLAMAQRRRRCQG